MMRVIVGALLVLALAGAANADIWKSCGKPSDDFAVSKVTIKPDPPVIGKPLMVSASGTLDKDVTAGWIKLQIKYGAITLINKNMSLCEVAAKTPDHCPFKKGPITISLTETIPSIAPPGDYTGHIVLQDQVEHEIACVNLDLKMSGLDQGIDGRFTKLQMKK
jgi:ML domain